MKNVSVAEVQRDAERLFDRVRDGETIVVTAGERPIAEIRPIQPVRRPRPFGLAKGTIVVPDDFDAPLPDAVLAEFER